MKLSVSNESMNLVVPRKDKADSLNNKGSELLRFAAGLGIFNTGLLALPQQWMTRTQVKNATSLLQGPGVPPAADKIYYKDNLPLNPAILKRLKTKKWLIVTNGRFPVEIDPQHLRKALGLLKADCTAVTAAPHLHTGCEKVLSADEGRLIGFRRFYSDTVQPAPIPKDWPHLLFIRTKILHKLLADGALPLTFSELLERCRSKSLTVHSLSVAGAVFDLETEAGLLAFAAASLKSKTKTAFYGDSQKQPLEKNTAISGTARFFGAARLGQNVKIAKNAIIVGPTVIGDNVTIDAGTVIKASIIGDGVCVGRNRLIQNQIIKEPQHGFKRPGQHSKANFNRIRHNTFNTASRDYTAETFRIWPRFSYARFLKRIADIIIAVIVLLLFAPVLPVIVLAVKLSSRGPVFFRDIRQGLHGKKFNCLKFRTMLVGSEKIQDRLRPVNEADGPQFIIKNDPRTNAVGRFLRETYIDEIPQFFNVLLGQMSAVGPRPSPESENTLCPPWRDARLSVRPGITGLWQICRTRLPYKDFQEWIHYDIKYVRDLSLRMDLWICWKTIRKIVQNFISQF